MVKARSSTFLRRCIPRPKTRHLESSTHALLQFTESSFPPYAYLYRGAVAASLDVDRVEKWLYKFLQAGKVMDLLHLLAYVSQNG